jgi:hypothetical protein
VENKFGDKFLEMFNNTLEISPGISPKDSQYRPRPYTAISRGWRRKAGYPRRVPVKGKDIPWATSGSAAHSFN